MIVNGRFLAATPTGLHRTGRALLDAARARGAALEVWAPRGVVDHRIDRHLAGLPGRLGAHAWEQVALPWHAHARPVLSLANTGPVAARTGLVMVHDLAPLVGPSWFAGSMRWYARTVLAAARRAVRVLTVSRVVADELAAAGVAPHRVAVVRPAVDALFRPAADDQVAGVRERLGLQGDYLVLTGWADPRKDAATAAAAHVEAARDRPHTLVLAGREHPTFAPVQLPAAPSVMTAGFVGEDDLVALLTGAAGVLYPSRYEGFGLPPLEAWACGTAALVSDLPVLRESTQGRGTYLPAGDVGAWRDGIVALLERRVPVPAPPAWTWDDAAAQLLSAIGSWI